MRNYVINFLANKASSLEGFVATAQIQLLSRIIKTGWLDDPDAHAQIVEDIMHFLKQPSTAHYHVGLKILNQLVSEMNQATPGTSLISQRKVAVSFRHNALLQIFQVSLQALQSLQSDSASEARLKEQATALTLACVPVVRFRGHLARRIHRGHRDDPGAFLVALAHRRTRHDAADVRRVQGERPTGE